MIQKVVHLDVKHPWQWSEFYKGTPAPKSLCITRYGGFGDMVQMSSILPYFKEQGYHITVNTTPRGYSIIKNDPHIDAFFIQDDGQVPPFELPKYWEKLATYFEKHIQLSECVEGTLLAVPGRPNHALPKDERHELMDINYMENIHRLAEIPENVPFRPEFYPTKKEDQKAVKFRKKLGDDSFVILWSLAGSSVHKNWPYTDTVFANLMTSYKNVKIILVGDELCKILEQGWEKEPRVLCRSGEWDIRTTLALLPYVDLVVGTETGVLNCAGSLFVPKVVVLSHSTKENLTKHWVNTIEMTPEDTPCYPCHQMHYGFKPACSRDKITGTSTCAANIGPDRVIDAIHWIIEHRGNINEYVPGTLCRPS